MVKKPVTGEVSVDLKLPSTPETARREKVSQTDVPAFSLNEALRVASAIFENYAGKPTKPFDVARAMELTPASTRFRMLSGASIAYGLTEGGYAAEIISTTPLARRILAPLEEGSDREGMIEAFLKPRIISEFCNKYDGSQLPREDIANNVLADLGVARSRTQEILSLIKDGAEQLGLVATIKGKSYLNLNGNNSHHRDQAGGELPVIQEVEETISSHALLDAQELHAQRAAATTTEAHKSRLRRVFITHGKNTGFIDPIRVRTRSRFIART